jgi:hypothetical protein
VLIEWETASETDYEGFNLWRNDTRHGGYEKINDALIPAEDDPSGAAYEYMDEEAVAGVKYYYNLEVVDIHGESQFFGPVSAAMPQAWGATEAQASLLTGAPAEGSPLPSELMAIALPVIMLLGWRAYRRRHSERDKLF